MTLKQIERDRVRCFSCTHTHTHTQVRAPHLIASHVWRCTRKDQWFSSIFLMEKTRLIDGWETVIKMDLELENRLRHFGKNLEILHLYPLRLFSTPRRNLKLVTEIRVDSKIPRSNPRNHSLPSIRISRQERWPTFNLAGSRSRILEKGEEKRIIDAARVSPFHHGKREKIE